ncbi:MAG: hypothetical protein EOO51_06970 [Flavobacterium sp.]|nr:MAG: hypothetical protein EOO51_06970 [Flavobacterium sp.]
MEYQNENIKSLILNIREKIGRPVSNRVVVAAIESLGIRSKDTESDYGIPSIYELADLIYFELTTSAEHKNAKNEKEKEALQKGAETVQLSDYVHIKAKIFLQYYPKGILHLAPIILQIAAIVVFGYSLWTFVGFNHVQSTAVVLGVIIGLVATGGFVQVIGRQASFYWNHEDYVMVRQTVNYLLKAGSISISLIMAVIFMSNAFLHLYPFEVLCVVFAYAFLIGLLLLLLAPLHTIEQRWVISVSIFAGTAVAILLKTQTTLMIYATHWIGIVVAIGIAKLFLTLYFRRLIKKKKAHSNLDIRPVLVFYHNYRYFLYGILIYIFIFIDRMLAWSSTSNGPLPFVVYFEKNYELGMDLAILVFLLLSGVLEYSVASFSKFIDVGQKLTSHDKPQNFNGQLKKMYWQNIVLMLVTAVGVFVLIYFIMHADWGYKGQFNEELLLVSVRVCAIGSAGYLFFAWGMLNTLYLFTLGQPAAPLKAIAIACATNIAVGFCLSRFVSYEFSVVGMLVGSIVFMAITLKAVLDYFNNLDYYYYAAY